MIFLYTIRKEIQIVVLFTVAACHQLTSGQLIELPYSFVVLRLHGRVHHDERDNIIFD